MIPGGPSQCSDVSPDVPGDLGALWVHFGVLLGSHFWCTFGALLLQFDVSDLYVIIALLAHFGCTFGAIWGPRLSKCRKSVQKVHRGVGGLARAKCAKSVEKVRWVNCVV